ncbi:MAG: CDP-diacylglycerol--serine O-phosphatidyltransferase [Bacteriovoracia bacterium]
MKKIYIVPNIVTTANMFCGFYSVIASISGNYTLAAWSILAATIFDSLDGRIARLAKATSSFGVQYDSLCDLISFGMAPAMLLFQWSLNPFGRLGYLAAFLFLACGALRLARFNVSTHVVPKGYFQGLPSPMAASVIATFVIFHFATGWPSLNGEASHAIDDQAVQWITLVLALMSASLMVSTVRFPSFKELNWRSRASFGYLMIGVMCMILIAVRPEVSLFLIVIGYIFSSLAWNLALVLRAKPTAVRQDRS